MGTSHWYTAADYARIAVGFLLFVPIVLAPGYFLGYGARLFDFRRRSVEAQLAIALALSIAVGPVLSFLLGQLTGLSTLGVIYAVACAGSLITIASQYRQRVLSGKRARWKLWAVAGCWLLVATVSMADWQMGQRLYFPVISFDTSIRAPMVNAIATFGLPARSPFFFAEHPALLRYHYFWLIQTAIVERFGKGWLDARQCYIAGGLWCGLGLMASIALYLRFLVALNDHDVRCRIYRAWLLLGITGLDILPALLCLVLTKAQLIQLIPPSVEWWNEQVDGWLYTMLWEPHYVAALIACLTGFLVLWQAAEKKMRDLTIAIAVAGFAFASGVGLSIYIAFVFAAFMAVWMTINLFSRRYRECVAIALTGGLALVLSLPFLHLTLQGNGSGGEPLEFSLRSFLLIDLVTKALGVSNVGRAATDLLLLPLNYFLELGFFFVAGAVMIRRFWNKEKSARHEVALVTMTVVSVLVCTFVRSGTIDHNDLGWRGFLIAQFALLIAAVELASKGILKRSRFMAALLMLGAAGTAYDLFLLRFFPVLSDAELVPKIGWISNDSKVGRRGYANREAYEWLREHSDKTAVIQQNPNPVMQDVFYGLYADRQTAAEDSGCVTTFGGDPAECRQLLTVIAPLYVAPPAESTHALHDACAKSPIDFFLAKDTDPEWGSRKSWIWRSAPVYANDYVRIFACDSRVQPARDEPGEY